MSDELVKVYVKVGMFDEAIDVLFQNSKVRGFVPRIWSCYCLTNLLIECRRVEMVVATYQHLQSIDSSPNDYTYTLAIEAFCARGSSEEAVDVFWEIQEPGVTPNAFAHTTYIEGLCTHQGSDPGCMMLQGLARVEIPIDVYVYTAVICGFCNEMKLKRQRVSCLTWKNKALYQMCISMVH